MKTNTYIYDNTSLSYSQKDKYLTQKSCQGNQNTHLMFNIFSENCAIYEIMWKKILHS
jgi:hypothetical protein